MDYNSFEHIKMTVDAGGSYSFAARVGLADFWPGSQGTDPAHANWHSTGGVARRYGRPDELEGVHAVPQKCGEAYAGAVATLAGLTRSAQAGNSASAVLAIHDIQDSYAAGHLYQFWPGGLPSWAHLRGDASFNTSPVDATRAYLKALRGAAPMQSPEHYLAPRPANCN